MKCICNLVSNSCNYVSKNIKKSPCYDFSEKTSILHPERSEKPRKSAPSTC